MNTPPNTLASGNDGRRVTANSFDIQVAMRDIASEDMDRRVTVDASMLRSFERNLTKESASRRESLESVDTLQLINSITDALNCEERNSSTISELEDSVQHFDRRETADFGDLASSLEEDDDQTVRSHATVDTMELIHSVDEVVHRIEDRGLMDTGMPDKYGKEETENSTVHRSPRRSRRLSIKSPTATINSSVVADTEYNSEQKELMKSFHAPVSVLKSCLSSKKSYKPSPSIKKVVFGSPSAVTFKKNSPAGKFTPLSKEKAKSLFHREDLDVIEEKADPITEENSRILEEWDRLSNISSYSSEEETPSKSPRHKRRSSRLQRPLSRNEPTEIPYSINDSPGSHTVSLPETLTDLLRESEALVPLEKPLDDRVDISGTDHTHELEADLQSLIRTVAIPSASHQSEGESPGLDECNKSWVDLSVRDASNSSSDKSLGPLIGLHEHHPIEYASDQSNSSSGRFTYEIEISRVESCHTLDNLDNSKNQEAPSSRIRRQIGGEIDLRTVATSPILNGSDNKAENDCSSSLDQETPFIDCVAHSKVDSVGSGRKSASPQFAGLNLSSPTSAQELSVKFPVSPLARSPTQVRQEKSDSDEKVSETVVYMLNRLKRLNTDARINTVLQSTTPSMKRSRIAMEIGQSTSRNSAMHFKRVRGTFPADQKRIAPMPPVQKSPLVNGSSSTEEHAISSVRQSPLADGSPSTEEHAVKASHDEQKTFTIEPIAPSGISANDDRAKDSSGADNKGTTEKQNNLFPILQEIELLKTRIDEIRRQKLAKRPGYGLNEEVKTHGIGDCNLVTLETEKEGHSSSTMDACNAICASEGVNAMVDALKIIDKSVSIDDINLLIDIVNRLTYCKVRKFKPSVIEIEVVLCNSYRIVLEFTLSFDNAFSTERKISSIHIDIFEKVGEGQINEFAKLYFAKILRSDELSAPLSNMYLDALRNTKDLIQLFKKVPIRI